MYTELLFNSLSKLQTKPLPPIRHICDFSRGVLNVRLSVRIQHLLPGHIYGVYSVLRFCFSAGFSWITESRERIWGFSEAPVGGERAGV